MSDQTPQRPLTEFEHKAWGEFAAGDRLCHFCGHPCLPEDHPATSKDGGHYAHFTCWYDRVPPARIQPLIGMEARSGKICE